MKTCKRGHPFTPDNRGKTGYCLPCRRDFDRRRRRTNAEYRKREAAAAVKRNARNFARYRAEGLAPDDRRHGTVHGYNSFGCRCDRCKQAIRLAQFLAAEKRRRRSTSVWAVSLDQLAERRFGMDRVAVGDEWDDPTFDAAVG